MNNSCEVANILLKIANNKSCKIKHLQIHSMLFLAHGYSLAILNTPLFYDSVIVSENGIRIPLLYDNLRKYGAEEITDYIAKGDDMPLIRVVKNDYDIKTEYYSGNITWKARRNSN